MNFRLLLLIVCCSLLLPACSKGLKEKPFRDLSGAPAPAPQQSQPKSAEQPAPRKDLKGWERPYVVAGERYEPLRGHDGFSEQGLASWYGLDFHGKKTSNGEVYDMHAMTAAHKTLPLGIHVKVTNLTNGKEIVVRLNDRGPFIKGRIIDLSYAGAQALDVVRPGTAPVRVEALGYRESDSAGRVSYRPASSYQIGTFAVQVGAFGLAENAQRLANQLQREHGAATVQEGWVNGQRFHRVRAGRYSTLEAADAARQKFEINGFPNSFVVGLE
jgi:rare lipoprotein A